jgi:hypothetical protein
VVPPPSVADVALEQLFKCQLKRPETVDSILIVTRLITSRWRKKVFKAGTFSFTVPASTAVWGKDQHEHLIFVSCLVLLSHRPWMMRYTQLVGNLERILHGMSSSDIARTGCILFKFLNHARTLDNLPFSVLRYLLRAGESGPIPNQGI